jgi:SSS family solute:Na+ symporter
MRREYLTGSIVMLVIAASVGLVTAYLDINFIVAVAPLAVLFIIVILFTRGLDAFREKALPSEYFGAEANLPAVTTLQSLGSSWVMLGNVVVAGMILGQTFGLVTIAMLVSWYYAFLLMSKRVRQVRQSLQPTDTLHTYLHTAYGSLPMRRVAASITVATGIGVFAIEIIAGLALLNAILPASSGMTIAALLMFLLVIVMCTAVSMGGLRAVVTTDAMLWRIVIAGAVTMLLFSTILFFSNSPGEPRQLLPKGLGVSEAVAFTVGVVALQVPLLLADYGTWQRIKATADEDIDELPKRMEHLGRWQAFLWLVPVVAGFAIMGVSSGYHDSTSVLYQTSGVLMDEVTQWASVSAIPIGLRTALLLIFMTGMLAIMVSTANSYILIAVETIIRDMAPESPRTGEDPDVTGRRCVVRARRLSIILALVGCVPAVLLVKAGIHLMGIIVIVFSVQVALAPAAALALYQTKAARQLASLVEIGTISGFGTAILFGLGVSYLGSEWWKFYGIYLTSPIALSVPVIAISVGLLSRGHKMSGVRGFLGKLFWAGS